jgi:L-arabinokinase
VSPPLVVFYVSGHGFGHASRQIEIINALLGGAEPPRVMVRTWAASWLFDLTLAGSVEFAPVECDTGIVQIDSLRLDERETILRASRFHETLPARAAAEAAALRRAGAALVVADVPPLACCAAAEAGVPAVALANFTWDWIYEEYSEQLNEAPTLLDTLHSAYAEADEGWRLPLGGGFESIGRVRELPFVARRASRSPDEVRRALGWPRDLRLAMPSFGGYGLVSMTLSQLQLTDWGIVFAERASALPWSGPSGTPVYRVDEDGLYARGLRYEDLVGAVDAIITKPGYGIIAECVANDTALVYTSRGRFREYGVLVAGMPRYLRAAFISQEDLFNGRWQAALDDAFATPAPAARADTNGAEVAACWILDRLHRGR